MQKRLSAPKRRWYDILRRSDVIFCTEGRVLYLDCILHVFGIYHCFKFGNLFLVFTVNTLLLMSTVLRKPLFIYFFKLGLFDVERLKSLTRHSYPTHASSYPLHVTFSTCCPFVESSNFFTYLNHFCVFFCSAVSNWLLKMIKMAKQREHMKFLILTDVKTLFVLLKKWAESVMMASFREQRNTGLSSYNKMTPHLFQQ